MSQEQEHVQPDLPLVAPKVSEEVLPEEAYREARNHRLGQPLKKYVESDPWRQSMPLLVTGFLCFAIFAFFMIIIVTSDPITPPSPGTIVASIYLLVLAAIPLILTIWGIIAVRGQAGRRGYLCTEGFLILTGSDQVRAALRIGRSRVRVALRWDDIEEVRMSWVFGMSTEHPEDIEQWQFGVKWRVITRANKKVLIASGYAGSGVERPTEMERLGFEICQAFQRLHPYYSTRRKHATTIYSA